MTLSKKKELYEKPWFKSILYVGGIALIFVIWAIIAASNSSGIFPSISKTFVKLGNLLSAQDIYVALGSTMLRLILSFLLTFFVSMILGILAGLFTPVKLFLKPIVLVLRTVPTAAVILTMVVLLRQDVSLFLLLFLLIFPIMYEAFVTGIEKVDQEVLNASKLDSNVFSFSTIFRVILPSVNSYVLLGIIQSLGIGMKMSIMAEVLIGSSTLSGLGIMLNSFYISTDMAGVFAVSLVAIVCIGIMDILLHTIKSRYKKTKSN